MRLLRAINIKSASRSQEIYVSNPRHRLLLERQVYHLAKEAAGVP